MILKRRKDKEFTENWIKKFEDNGLTTVKLFVSQYGSFQDVYKTSKIETIEQYDSIKNTETVMAIFKDDTVLELPMSGFRSMFEVIPEGPLTQQLFGDNLDY